MIESQLHLEETPQQAPPKKKRKPVSWQLSLRAVGRPRRVSKSGSDSKISACSTPKKSSPKISAQYWDIVDAPHERQLIPMDFVRNRYSQLVLCYDSDDKGFVCKCGQHLSLANPNYCENIKQHFNSTRCLTARKHRPSSITRFFRPVKQYQRPDPKILCHGFWSEFVTIDGVKCRLDLLGEYANRMLYYVSGRTILLSGKTHDAVATATRSIHSVACLGHALDDNNNLRPSRTCLACSSLVQNKDFRRMLLQAQDPARFQSSHKLPDQFYSWKHLQVLNAFQYSLIL